MLVVSRQQHRVEELASEHGADTVDASDFSAGSTPLAGGAIVVASADLTQGFAVADGSVHVYTDAELFGAIKRRRSVLARGSRRAVSTSARGSRRAASGNAAREAFVLQFAPGDLVVHRDHGISRFVEMRAVTDDSGAEHEYMLLEYADGDRLFVPTQHLDRVDRYVGGAESHPKLSRLGTGEWERTRRRVKERTEEVARELLGLYSRREQAQGHAYAPDGAWQQELEGSFPYQETPDQVLVLEEIKRDMEASRPMDRVVCGDVGFGKTELAIRAAFKAAIEGRQVAMLVPTTVLCQQHFITFTERLAAFPITVRQLSRFVSDEEIARTLAGLRSGAVDIVVGTHRLLQKDVEFKNLGLVVIDEEQRFGVLQKERFKELRVAVDVLSLSATPIPRTLHMSLAGIRDLSVIQTPPEERQPIKTYVTAREDSLIREVITRELARGGQCFFLHNRVAGIEAVADRLRALVPEARIEVAHGQMPEGMLASVMRRFGDGEIDVLLCTTIIESGLDIPNANTIVIDDAHRLGLAQLYQLRGRVGRAGQRAYAYMMYPPARSLTEKADKRLDVIGDLQDLGAGFKLAMRDLEIRGAGNLLGEEQHGEIAAVGLELYNHLLADAVTSLQGKPVLESPAQVTVTLPVAAFLPADYVSDERLRLRCYQELAACVSEVELEQRARGLVDRFGPMPAPTSALIDSLRVRLLAAAAGALGVETERGRGVVIRLTLDHGLDLQSVAAQFRGITATPSQLHLGDAWQTTLTPVLRELGPPGASAAARYRCRRNRAPMREESVEALRALNEVIEQLRAPGGCPWDREQTHRSLRPYLLEETYEVLEAIDSMEPGTLREELGDLLLQVLMHSAIAMEADGGFDIGDVAVDVRAKMIHRHPHVFGDVAVDGAAGVVVNWEKLKTVEKRDRLSLLDGVPAALPALAHAQGVQKRPARVGFDETPTSRSRSTAFAERAARASRTIAGGLGARRSAARTGRRRPGTPRRRSATCSSRSWRSRGVFASIPRKRCAGGPCVLRCASVLSRRRRAWTASTCTTSTTRTGSERWERTARLIRPALRPPLSKRGRGRILSLHTRRHIPPFVSLSAGKRTESSVPLRVRRSTAPSRCAGLQSCSSPGSADLSHSRCTDRWLRRVISTHR